MIKLKDVFKFVVGAATLGFAGAIFGSQAALTIAAIAYTRKRNKKAQQRSRTGGVEFTYRNEVRHIPVLYGRNKIGGISPNRKTFKTYTKASPIVGSSTTVDLPFSKTGNSTTYYKEVFDPTHRSHGYVEISENGQKTKHTLQSKIPENLSDFPTNTHFISPRNELYNRGAEQVSERETYTKTKHLQDGSDISVTVTTKYYILKKTYSYPGSKEFKLTDDVNEFPNKDHTGENNQYLITQQALSHGVLNKIVTAEVNGLDWNSAAGDFNHYLVVNSSNRLADPIATANELPSTHTFDGLTYATQIFRLDIKDNQYNYSGEPEVAYYVEGIRVYNVENVGSDYVLGSPPTYSNNPALVLLDYLLNPNYGRGLDINLVDLKSFYDAKEICDRTVFSDAFVNGKIWLESVPSVTASGSGTGAEVSSWSTNVSGQITNVNWADGGSGYATGDTLTFTRGATTGTYSLTDDDLTSGVLNNLSDKTIGVSGFEERRDVPLYECNLAIDTSRPVRDNIELILDTMGEAELIWSEGLYKLQLDYPLTQADEDSLIPESNHINDSTIIKDSTKLVWPSGSDRYNQAIVRYKNEHEDFQDDVAIWPKSHSSVYNTYKDQDTNIPLQAEFTYPAITDPYHALAKAEQLVRTSRESKVLDIVVDRSYLHLEQGDLIRVDDTTMGIDSKIYPEGARDSVDETMVRSGYPGSDPPPFRKNTFKIEKIQVTNEFNVKIQALGYSYGYLAWNVDDDIPSITRTAYNFSIPAPTNLTYTSGSSDILGVTSGKLTWDFPTTLGVVGFVVEVSRDGGTTWELLGNVIGRSFDLPALKAEMYSLSVRAITATGRYGPRATIDNTDIDAASFDLDLEDGLALVSNSNVFNKNKDGSLSPEFQNVVLRVITVGTNLDKSTLEWSAVNDSGDDVTLSYPRRMIVAASDKLQLIPYGEVSLGLPKDISLNLNSGEVIQSICQLNTNKFVISTIQGSVKRLRSFNLSDNGELTDLNKI